MKLNRLKNLKTSRSHYFLATDMAICHVSTMEKLGKLAQSTLGEEFELQVLHSHAGFYIGTENEDGVPVSRESEEYFQDEKQAIKALESGKWTQRPDILS